MVVVVFVVGSSMDTCGTYTFFGLEDRPCSFPHALGGPVGAQWLHGFVHIFVSKWPRMRPTFRKKSTQRKQTTESKKSKEKATTTSREAEGTLPVPDRVREAARLAFQLRTNDGFRGVTETGWKQARKLADGRQLTRADLKTMRAWFARHQFSSLPSYEQWVDAGRPRTPEFKRKGGIVAILCWGGPAAMKLVNSWWAAAIIGG